MKSIKDDSLNGIYIVELMTKNQHEISYNFKVVSKIMTMKSTKNQIRYFKQLIRLKTILIPKH